MKEKKVTFMQGVIKDISMLSVIREMGGIILPFLNLPGMGIPSRQDAVGKQYFVFRMPLSDGVEVIRSPQGVFLNIKKGDTSISAELITGPTHHSKLNPREEETE